jgi:hypothetical protein
MAKPNGFGSPLVLDPYPIWYPVGIRWYPVGIRWYPF